MCFSAEASFAGGVIISAIGIASVTKVQRRNQILFACIPLFFGIQQIIEGFLWLIIPHPEYIAFQKIGAYLYLIFAQALWPLIIPLSVMLMEENPNKRRILKILLILGVGLSVFYASCLLIYSVSPQINCYHILYASAFPPAISNSALVFYLIAAFTPLFISSIRGTKMMGGFMLISCIISILFFTLYLTSVWCFFAALISAVVFWILKDSKRHLPQDPGIHI
jgi:hypothetical protein